MTQHMNGFKQLFFYTMKVNGGYGPKMIIKTAYK